MIPKIVAMPAGIVKINPNSQKDLSLAKEIITGKSAIKKGNTEQNMITNTNTNLTKRPKIIFFIVFVF